MPISLHYCYIASVTKLAVNWIGVVFLLWGMLRSAKPDRDDKLFHQTGPGERACLHDPRRVGTKGLATPPHRPGVQKNLRKRPLFFAAFRGPFTGLPNFRAAGRDEAKPVSAEFFKKNFGTPRKKVSLAGEGPQKPESGPKPGIGKPALRWGCSGPPLAVDPHRDLQTVYESLS